MADVAVLFARADSNYKALPGVDVWDADRDARRWPGGCSVVAHPPCRAWGRLRKFARPRRGERALAIMAIRAVRQWGGVLEHPSNSTLFDRCGLPRPGKRDAYGGFTIGINQNAFGHRAEKPTWLYIVGIEPKDLPPIPFVLGEATHVIQSRKRNDYRPHVSKAEREHTPPALCVWLVEVARRCASHIAKGPGGEARALGVPWDGGLGSDQSAHIGIKAGCLGKQLLQLVAIDAFMHDQVLHIVIVQPPKAHLVSVVTIQTHGHAVSFAPISRQLHCQSAVVRDQVAGSGHCQKTVSAKLLQYGFCYVHFPASSKHYRAAHGVKQRKAIDSGRAAVNGAQRAVGGQLQALAVIVGLRCGFAVDQAVLPATGPALLAQGQRIELAAFIAGANEHGLGLLEFKDAIGRQAGRHGIAAQGQASFNIRPVFDAAAPGGFVFVNIADPDAGIGATLDKEVPDAIIVACGSAIVNLAGFKADGFSHGSRSFLTTCADYSSGVICSYKPEPLNQSSGFFAAGLASPERRAKAGCQSLKYARSGRVADAERGHSAKYARSGRAADAERGHSAFSRAARTLTRVDRSPPVDHALSFFVSLTPARWDAMKLAAKLSAPIGLGGMVARLQSCNRFCNRHHLEIIEHSCAVAGLQPCASRDARVRTCVGPCAYMRARNPATLQPASFIYILEIVSGCKSGCSFATLQPAPIEAGHSHAFPRFSIKIAGQYALRVVDLPCRGLMRGGGRENFGDFLPGRVELGSCGELGAGSLGALLLAGQSDGFLRVSAGRTGHVGMPMLERSAQGFDMPCISAMQPLPIGKASHPALAPWARSAGHPPMPPFGIAPSSSSMAPERDRILIGLPVCRPAPRRAPLNHIGTMRGGLRGKRRKFVLLTGPGEPAAVQLNPANAGRGMMMAGKLRRFGQANGGLIHVN